MITVVVIYIMTDIINFRDNEVFSNSSLFLKIPYTPCMLSELLQEVICMHIDYKLYYIMHVFGWL